MANPEAKSVHAHRSTWLDRIRVGIVTVLVVLATVAMGVYVVVHWAERQVLNTDNWVALVSPLPKQPVVASALGNYISTQIFASGAVEAKIADALPPRAAFLAGPLTSQVKTLTTKTAQNFVKSDFFQTIWTTANRTAMNRIVSQARGDTPTATTKLGEKFNLNLSGSQPKLASALGGVASALPALKPATEKAIVISTNLHAQRQQVSKYVKTIDTLSAVLPFLIIAAFLGGLALSKHRRRLTLIVAVSIMVMMLIELIGLKWLNGQILDQVRNPANLPAVEYIAQALTGWLRQMMIVVLLSMAVLSAILLVAGPADWANTARKYIRTDYLMQTKAMVAWRELRMRSKAYEYYGWLVVVLVVLVGTALAGTVNGRVLINAFLIACSMIAVVHIFVSPPPSIQTTS